MIKHIQSEFSFIWTKTSKNVKQNELTTKDNQINKTKNMKDFDFQIKVCQESGRYFYKTDSLVYTHAHLINKVWQMP